MERVAIILGFVLSACAGFLIYFMDVSTEGGAIHYTNVYMTLSAIAQLFIVATIRFASRDKFTQNIAEFGMILSLSQILDELFFTPNIIQVNEVVLFTGGLIWLLYRFKYIKIGRNG